jgi:cortactin
VEKDRMDKSAVGHDYIGKVEKHASQKDYSEGFGGKYGVQKDRMDKSAVGHDYIGKVEKHASQKDYSEGFGGKYGVQKDRMDKSAVGHDYIGKVEKHASQKDYSEGFGGKYGVQKDRMDKSAVGFQDVSKVGTNYEKTTVKPDILSEKPSNLRAKFENFAIQSEENTHERSLQQKKLREEKDRLDREQATKEQEHLKSSEPTHVHKPQRAAVVTGRTGGISSAITAFNTPEPEAAPVPVRSLFSFRFSYFAAIINLSF